MPGSTEVVVIGDAGVGAVTVGIFTGSVDESVFDEVGSVDGSVLGTSGVDGSVDASVVVSVDCSGEVTLDDSDEEFVVSVDASDESVRFNQMKWKSCFLLQEFIFTNRSCC